MKFTDDVHDRIVVFELSGKIMGGDQSTRFHGRVREYINNNQTKFVIDLDKVDWINSVGLGMLISAMTTISKADGRMVLTGIHNVESILSLTRLIKIFETHDSKDEAIAALRE
jgi:anti-sigma B factor antagonist